MFLEKPSESEYDYSTIQYDDKLNLSIDINTNLPAIDSLNMETQTFTKTSGETADSDVNFSMDTATRTQAQLESTDSDSDIRSFSEYI